MAFSTYRLALPAAASIAVLIAAGTGWAQQPAAPAAPAAAPAAPAQLPAGSPLIGRPDNNEAAAKLAPVPSPPLPASADNLPASKLKLPKGFHIEVYASGIP